MNRFTTWIITAILFISCIILSKMLYNSYQINNSLNTDIINLQSTLSLKPKIIKIDSIVYNDRVFNVFKVPQIAQNNTTSKSAIIGQKKLDSLNTALGIKTKDLLAYKEFNANLLIQNQKLESNSKNPNKVEYKDKFITLVIDRETNTLDSLQHKINLISASYEKKPKWYKGKEEFYTVSVDDKRMIIDVTGFDEKPKVLKSMLYIDNNYKINPQTLKEGVLSSTLNYEWGMDNIVSPYLGAGVQTSFEKPIKGIINAGLKINLYRNKK